MVACCAAVGCKNRKKKGSGISFFRFPQDSARRKQWVASMRRAQWTPRDWDRLCSAHFVSGRPSRSPREVDYVPSVFFFTKPPSRRTIQRTAEGRRAKAAKLVAAQKQLMEIEEVRRRKRVAKKGGVYQILSEHSYSRPPSQNPVFVSPARTSVSASTRHPAKRVTAGESSSTTAHKSVDKGWFIYIY